MISFKKSLSSYAPEKVHGFDRGIWNDFMSVMDVETGWIDLGFSKALEATANAYIE